MDSYSYLNISAGPGTGALDLFVAGTEEVYVISPVDRGWRFSRVTRRGTVSVTVADGRLLSGARILDALRVASACPGGGNELFAALKAAEVPQAPLRAPDDMLPSLTQLTEGAGTAVRHFLSGRDIEHALSFPFQKSTEAYACTILAPATAAMRPAAECDTAVARITSPLDRRYAVIYPEGVRPSEREIDFGKELSLTYFAEGMKEATHHLLAGKPSPFVEYDGAAMRVRPLSALGIRLEPIPKPDPAPAAPSQPSTASTPRPGYRTVTLSMRFSDDRVVRSELTLNDNTSEYRLLRAGMFHGHRARRLAVKTHGEASYLIDLREEPAPEVNPEPTPVAERKEDTARKRKRRSGSPWIVVILAFVAIALGIVAVSYLPGLFEHVNTYDTDEPSDSVATIPEAMPASEGISLADTAIEILPEQPQAAMPAPVDPSADFAYLNKATVWQRDSLRSPEALAVFDVFATGNLGRIPQTPFFASGKCTNPAVMKTVKLIWQAKGSSTQTGNQRALRNLEGATMIDFDALFLELAGIRPANPNNRPLPSTATNN